MNVTGYFDINNEVSCEVSPLWLKSDNPGVGVQVILSSKFHGETLNIEMSAQDAGRLHHELGQALIRIRHQKEGTPRNVRDLSIL